MALTRLDNLYSSKSGKYLYVSPDDFNATDELDNRGNSPLRPFKTIQRAFIEVARFSYLPGKDNDRFDQFSIMLMPGDHYIDNRPGLVEIDTASKQRFYDAKNLINLNRQEIIDRAFAEIAIQYDEVAWGTDWVVPGDPVSQAKNRFYDSYRLIQKNRQEIIDRSVAEIAIQHPDFYYPDDPQETSVSRYKDAYRLIQLNRDEIVNNAWNSTVAIYPGVASTELKCKRDIGYFVDAISLDIHVGGNTYARKFVLQYFNGNTLITNGIASQVDESVYAFNQARDLMRIAITNQLTVKDFTISTGQAIYNGGGGDIPNTSITACSDVQTAINNLTSIVTTVLNDENLNNLPPETVGVTVPGEEKCKRDTGFLVDAISLDVVQGSGNVYTRKLLQNYFNEAGSAWIEDGLLQEEVQSVTAFNKARDLMNAAITNALYYKDLSLTVDPDTNNNQDPASCANVQSFITNLISTVTTVISDGSLVNLPEEDVAEVNPGEEKCKRDIGYIVDAVASDLANGGNANSIAAARAYFDKDGLPIDNGLVGEEAQSVFAFNAARDMMQKAVTNQLYEKDLTILSGPAEFDLGGPNIPNLPSGNAATCIDVQTNIANLIQIITGVISDGDLSGINSIQITGDVPVFNYNRALEQWQDNTILDLNNPDNALYKFNSTTGGCIVPRGCSLIGYDLRRTIVRPLYVPDPADATQERTSIFNLTGGCYLWQFTIKDGDLSENSPLYDPSDKVGKVYFQKGNNSSLAVPEYSHHKICIMTYADNEELDRYYDKVGRAFSLFQPSIDDGELEALVQENRIVGPLSDTRNITNIRLESNTNPAKTTIVVTTKIAHGYFRGQYVAVIDNGLNDQLNGTFKVTDIDDENPRVFKYEVSATPQVLGLDINAQGYDFTTVPSLELSARVQAEIDSVESASPYVFNCSIRSTWGMCGMWADGAKATGFKSMVVAQYTGVSLQRDDRAFIRYDEFTNTWNQASITDAFSTVPYHTKGDAYWKDDWRNFHIRASDDAFIQCVSVFAVGFFDHFLMESGGDMSITNSNSNFGNTSLHAVGFKGFSFNQDKGGYITDIVPVETVDDSEFNETNLKYYSIAIQQTKDTSNQEKLYYGSDEAYDPFKKPTTSIDGFKLGSKTDETIFLNIKSPAGTTVPYEATVSPNGFVRYTASLETLNPDGVVVDNLAQDASNLIELNKQFIQQEAYGYIIQKYPYLLTTPGITIDKCERDIGYFVDAVVSDLRLGGNINTIQAAEAYYVGGNLNYINGELNETVDALDYVKNLCIASMRNFDYLIRNCFTTSGSPIVDIGDTTGIVVGMKIGEYDYNTTNFTNGRLNPGAQPVAFNPTLPPNVYVKRILDGSRIEIGTVGSKLDQGSTVNALITSPNVYLYFSFPQTATPSDNNDILVGAWAATNPVRDSSVIQDQSVWGPTGDGYPECVSIATTIQTYFDDINLILNQGLIPLGGKYIDASNLIEQNKQFIANEAIDLVLASDPGFTFKDGRQSVIDSVISVLEDFSYNIKYGGNNRVYDSGLNFVANPSITNTEEEKWVDLFDQINVITSLVVKNSSVTIVGTHGLLQYFDGSIIGEQSGIPGVYSPSDCADVVSTIDSYVQLIQDSVGTSVSAGSISAYNRSEPTFNSVTRVEPTLDTANLATRATVFTINTGGGTSNPHNFETGTPVRLVPKAKPGTNPDKRLIRLPRGFETNTVYYVIAPGRTTQPENYADGATYPGIFEPSSGTKLMLARTKDNAAAGIYMYSPETDSIDSNVEIELQQYVLDVDYALHQYKCSMVNGQLDIIATDVPHVFDVPGTPSTVHKVFFRPEIGGTILPSYNESGSISALDQNTYYYVRFVTPKTFAVYLTASDAISGANRIVFSSVIAQNFYVFSDKRRSPIRFDAQLVDESTSTGSWYINTIPDLGNTSNIIDRLQTLGESLKDSRSKNTYFKRLNDNREAKDRIYRLRYVIPEYAEGVRDPLNGFVIKARTDETRRLIPQRIVLEKIASGSSNVAVFRVNVPQAGGGTIQQSLGLPASELDPNFSYDPYNVNSVKVIDSSKTDSKVSFSIQSARTVYVGPDPDDARLELTVFNHGITNDLLRNEKFVTVKINAPQGGNFRVNTLAANFLNKVTWSGFSSGVGYIQGYFNVPGTDEHYLILKAIEDDNVYSKGIQYNQFVDTVFSQPVLNADNDPTFDINGNPITIFATLQAKPDSVGDAKGRSKSDRKDYLYSIKEANVLTVTPGDIIEDDTGADYRVISVEDVGQIEDTFYIFDIDEVQRRIPNQQEGIYYLTCLKGNISPYPTGPGVGTNFRNFKFSQPISQLYPLNYKNDPLWFQVQPDGTRDASILDTPPSICAADNYIHGLVTTNDAKNSETKEAVFDLVNNPALDRYEYITNPIQAQSGNATSGSEDRLIPICGDSEFPTERKFYVELRRPSIARSGNHTFEYLGFGPGNYSTGFPLRQEVVLADIQDFYAQAKREDAGIVFYTGLNSNGDLYIGNRKINAITGEETFLEKAELVDSDDEGGDLGGLVTTFELPVVFERDITVDGDANFNNPVTINVEPSEGAALTVISNLNSGAGEDPTLDSSSFILSDIFSQGNIVAHKNNIYSAVFTLNPRGNTTLSGQNYSIRTHVDSFIGNFPSNHTPNQSNSSIGKFVQFGNQPVKTGDILLKGLEVGKTGSLGWIYSNFFDDVSNSLSTIEVAEGGSNTVKINLQFGITTSDLDISTGSILRLSSFTGRFQNLNGLRLAENVTLTSFEITIPFIVSSDPADPTPLSSLTPDPKIEASRNSWKEFGVLGSESIRTNTDNWGDFRIGVNTLARAKHGTDGDQIDGFVSDAVNPRANLDVVGTVFISGKTLSTNPNNFLSNPLLANRTFNNVPNALLVGGDSVNPDQSATFRISTTNNGRVGINVSLSELDSTFVVDGDARITEDLTLESNFTIQGSNLISTSPSFSLLSSNVLELSAFDVAEEIFIANSTSAEQLINIGNNASKQTTSLGQFSEETELQIHSNSNNALVVIANTGNSDTSYSNVIKIGGAYANNSDSLIDGSLFKVYNRYAYFDGDVGIGKALPSGTGIAKLQSNSQTVDLFTVTTSRLNIGTSASILSIGALGGNTTINNTLNVGGDAKLFGDTTLFGGLNSGQFQVRRGSFSTPVTTHVIGNEIDNFNIDLYRKRDINILLDTQGAAFWGSSIFKDTSDPDPSVYFLYISNTASTLEFEVGSFVLIDRSVEAFNSLGVSTQGTAPIGQQYSELVQVIELTNLSDIGANQGLRIKVKRGRNYLNSDGSLVADSGQPSGYRYLRQDHPDNAKLIRYDLARDVSFLTDNLLTTSQGTLQNISTGNVSGTINSGDILRLSADDNGNLGELTFINAINQTSDQRFVINDGGSPAVDTFIVNSVSGDTEIFGNLTVRKNITLSGSTSENSQRFVITNGTTSSFFEKFVVDSFDGETFISGDLRVGENTFNKFTVDSATGNTTINGGNLVVETSGTQKFILQNSTGNLTISGVIRTQANAENIISGDLTVDGGDFEVNKLVDDGSGTNTFVQDNLFRINNDGSMDFAKQTGFFTPSGARKWEYVGGGIEVFEAESNINYFVAPSTDTTIKLPQNPTTGDIIRVVDIGGLLTFNISLRFRAPNGTKIQGDVTNSGLGPNPGSSYATGGELIVQTPNAGLGLVYVGSVSYDGAATGVPTTQQGWWLIEI